VSSAQASQASRWSGGTVPVWYLISCRRNNRLKVLRVFSESGRETVPVFGTEEAAGSFLGRGGFGPGWHVRETTAGELISLLLSHLRDVDLVSTDPRDPTRMDLWTTRKKEFIGVLMGEPLLVPAV
jgi:hypothetical protein